MNEKPNESGTQAESTPNDQPKRTAPKYAATVKSYDYEKTNGLFVTIQAIVIKDTERPWIQRFTGLETYSQLARSKNVIPNASSMETPLSFVTSFLNTLPCIQNGTGTFVFDKEDLSSFFNGYAADGSRADRTISRCISSVTAFADELRKKYPDQLPFSHEDLYQTVSSYGPKGCVQKEVPAFKVRTDGITRISFRDIPLRVIPVVLNEAWVHDPMIFFAFLSQFCGCLREGEVMSMRGQDSCFGPGMILEMSEDAFSHVKIDLTKNYVLRPGLKSQGTIKRCRMVPIIAPYLKVFQTAYEHHLELRETIPYDHERSPLFVDRNGNAMTKDAYRARLKVLIKQRVIPALQLSKDPDLVLYGQKLAANGFCPHQFRHAGTVALVNLGASPQEIQHIRGDANPEVALHYTNDKQDLLDTFRNAGDTLIDFLFNGVFSLARDARS